ncbi:MAG: SNF2-related protein [Nevskia sp.]|nr:SNF2-related protein [Nevskia sp.]
MSLLDRFRGAPRPAGPQPRMFAVPDDDGLTVVQGPAAPPDDHWPVTSELAAHLLAELTDQELAQPRANGHFLPWKSVYTVVEDPDRCADLEHLALPPIGKLSLRLRSENSLADEDFIIGIDGWMDQGRPTMAERTGAIVRIGTRRELLPNATYELAESIVDFYKENRRTPDFNRKHWSKIRSLAMKAGAGMDQFLATTIVVTPEKLAIRLVDTDVAGTGVLEIQPWFKGAPDEWLEQFDRAASVRDRYSIATASGGLVDVIITPKVSSVLGAIKAMPGRRAAGPLAERFVENPFAALGPDANDVIDEHQFEAARDEAGIRFQRFIARVDFSNEAVPKVGVVIETLSQERGEAKFEAFASPNDLKVFIAKIETKIQAGFQIAEWRRHRLQLDADTGEQLEILRATYIEWTKPKIEIRAADVMDLKRYSERVAGIGVQERIVSPYIPKNSEQDPWFPEPPLDVGGKLSVEVPLDNGRQLDLLIDTKVYKTLCESVATAEAAGKATIDIPGHPGVLPVDRARALVEELQPRFSQAPPPPRPPPGPHRTLTRKERHELLLRGNIDSAEFSEQRALDLRLPLAAQPQLPRGLKSSVKLKDHQLQGIAWMQHLLALAPLMCRGAVLADDMGLGKTLQLLTVICFALEHKPTLNPILVIAPVALLENWKEEASKFFAPGALPILELCGETLNKLRVPRSAIEAELLDRGIAKFLRSDWLGNAKIVLTTYETLRDLEFSLATVRWSMMICDESQKIKNPAAMVTRAAKKQNAEFRIACTGTPVENTLADLWCLFDFVQPGLLGSLNEFGSTYRRPIECQTDEERARVEQLRELINPQILRRTKADVAKDLPPKVVVESARQLKLSDYQRRLYSDAMEQFKLRNDPNRSVPFKNHLGLLQYLRKICIAPQEYGRGSKLELLQDYKVKNPKIAWLMDTLKAIRSANEKAIVFCEFREMQVMLRHYIEQVFQLTPDIINGDTESASTAADSRQKRIKRFSESPGFGVIILSPIAVGFGVNIQAANHVIHFTRTWNPAKEDQATDRAYRIGQEKTVYVYYPVVRADFPTFDVKLDQLLERKRTLSHDMLNGAGSVSEQEFEDIVEIDDRIFDERIMIDGTESLDGRTFEALIAALWKRRGFNAVELTPASGDGGVDVIARRSSAGELVQCKSSSMHGHHLGWEAIKDLVTGEARYRYEHPGIQFRKIAVTNQHFNSNTQHQAQLNNVELIERADLAKLLEEHRIVRRDVDAVLASPTFIRLPA